MSSNLATPTTTYIEKPALRRLFFVRVIIAAARDLQGIDMNQNEIAAGFAAVATRMHDIGLPALAIRTFEHYYKALARGSTGLLPESQISPAADVPRLVDLPADINTNDALGRTVVIKLNGGLGTSMGLNQAKSLLPAREGVSFLELIARQILHLRASTGHAVPLLLMNSFNTEADSLALLAKLPELATGQGDVPLSFLQHRVPRLLEDSLMPVSWPEAPEREWCPPGHGDLYTALMTTGLLDRLLARGYRWAFVSNADNLGASLEPAILDLMARESIPFLMEVTRRTAADRKGGHVARDHNGQLILRESAQCPAEDQAAFQDIERHRYFNTNNLWLDLQALKDLMSARNGVLGLPLIKNRKHVVPDDKTTPAVIQIETAMGAAISAFPGARILEVPRTRFAPVKTTSDLLVLWSDRYQVDAAGLVQPTTQTPLTVDLDPEHYGSIDKFQARFPSGAPSLIEAHEFSVRGDVVFDEHITIRGKVHLRRPPGHQHRITSGTVLSDSDEQAEPKQPQPKN